MKDNSWKKIPIKLVYPYNDTETNKFDHILKKIISPRRRTRRSLIFPVQKIRLEFKVRNGEENGGEEGVKGDGWRGISL